MAPDTQFTSGPSGDTNNTSPSFGLSSTESGSTFQCRIDAGSWSSCTSPKSYSGLAVGQHTIEAKATDAAGNTDASPASRTFTIDTTAPDTTVTSGPTELTNSTTASIAFSSTETGSTFECRLDSGSWSSCSSPKSYASLGDGLHTVDVRATDPAGNLDATPASRTFTVDATPPDTSITSGPNGSTNNTTAAFSFSSTESGSSFECRIDAGTWSACTAPKSYSALADGQHTAEVRSTDMAGNVDASSASRSFTVDTMAPDTQVDSSPPAFSASTAASFGFSSSEAGSSFECRLDSGQWNTCTSPKNYSALGEGGRSFDARATDPAGNVDATPANYSWTVDTTAPETRVKQQTFDLDPGLPMGWVDQAQISTVTEARDQGSGIRQFQLNIPNAAPPPANTTLLRSYPCQGGPNDPCLLGSEFHPSDLLGVTGPAFAYNTRDMPEGIQTVSAQAIDLAGNVSTTTQWQLRVDHTDPQLALGGSLMQAAQDEEVVTGTRHLTVDASDPSGSGQSTPSSGVQSVEILVDGDSVFETHYPADPADPCDGCKITLDHAFNPRDYEDGGHSIEVDATDAAGLSTSRFLNVEVEERQSAAAGTSAQEAEQQTATADPSAVAASQPVMTNDGPLDPSIAQQAPPPSGGSYTSTGTAVSTEISPNLADGVSLDVQDTEQGDTGELTMTPVNDPNNPDDAPLLSNAPTGTPVTAGDAVIYPDTYADAHAVTRPTIDGVENFVTLVDHDADSQYSWQIALDQDDAKLNLSSDGAVEIIDPHPDVSIAANGAEPVPQDDPNITEQDLEQFRQELANDEDPANDEDLAGVGLATPEQQVTADVTNAADDAGVVDLPSGDGLPQGMAVASPSFGSETTWHAQCDPPLSAGVEPPLICENPPFDAEAQEPTDPQDPFYANVPDPNLPAPSTSAELDDQAADVSTETHDVASSEATSALTTEDAAADQELANQEDTSDDAILHAPLVIAEIEPPTSLDADGDQVTTDLSVDNSSNTVTLHVQTNEVTNDDYPVVADPQLRAHRAEVHFKPTAQVRSQPHVEAQRPKWNKVGTGMTGQLIRDSNHVVNLGAKGAGWRGWHQIAVGNMPVAVTKKGHGPVYALSWKPKLTTKKVAVGTRPEPVVRSSEVVELRATKDVKFGYNEAFVFPPHGPNHTSAELVGPMLDAASAGGSDVSRMFVSWCLLAENNGPATNSTDAQTAWGGWSYYDSFFNLVRTRNTTGGASDDIRLDVQLIDAPGWANGNPSETGCSHGDPNIASVPPTPDRLGDWTMFVDAVMKRYFDPYPRSTSGLVAVEAWNEPNFGKFWGDARPPGEYSGDPQAFADLVNATNAGVGSRSVDIILGGIFPGPEASTTMFIRKTLANLDPDAITGIGIHLYANELHAVGSAETGKGAVGKIWSTWTDEFRPALNGTGYRNADVWITEIGFPLLTGPNNDGVRTKDEQRMAFHRAYNALASIPQIKAFIAHRLVSDATENKPFGVGHFDDDDTYVPRPAYCSLAGSQPHTPTPQGC